MTDGIWSVGRDVPPGKYQATSGVTDQCYWWIYPDKANGMDQYLSNGANVAGERPTVDLLAGQKIQVWHCGTWAAAAAV